jgi:hypothetical protein
MAPELCAALRAAFTLRFSGKCILLLLIFRLQNCFAYMVSIIA